MRQIVRGNALEQHGCCNLRLEIVWDCHQSLARDADLLGVGAEGLVPRHHCAFRNFSLWVVDDSPSTFESGNERGGRIIDTLTVIGIDVVDAGHDDVYQDLIVIRGGGGNFGIAKYFWSAGFCDLNCVHIARLAQKAGRVQDFGRLVALRVKPSRVLLLARLGVRRTFHRR